MPFSTIPLRPAFKMLITIFVLILCIIHLLCFFNIIPEKVIMSPLVTVSIMQTDVSIDVATYSSAYFKPGIPYTGKVSSYSIF